MTDAITKNRRRQLVQGFNFTDMSEPHAPRLLTERLKAITAAVNEDRIILAAPTATGLTTFSPPSPTKAVVITWNDVPLEYAKSIYGARIWRANVADDDNPDFYRNNARSVLVERIRSTKWLDFEGTNPEEYLYWVQWMNLDGEFGRPAGGIIGTF